jgi:hypothetical protein
MYPFQECLQLLRNRTTVHLIKEDSELISSLFLPLSINNWINLCMQGGDSYVGGCCTAFSCLQDSLNRIFRDGGFITVSELEFIAETVVTHGEGLTENLDFGVDMAINDLAELATVNWEFWGPWDKISYVWHLVKGHYTSETPDELESDPVKASLNTLDQCLRYLSLAYPFHGKFDMAFSDFLPDIETQTKAMNLVTLYRFIPAIRGLFEYVNRLSLPPMEGVVLILTGHGPEVVARNAFGISFYVDLAEIRGKVWSADSNHGGPLGFRKVRVSLEKGLEFLDDGPIILQDTVHVSQG